MKRIYSIILVLCLLLCGCQKAPAEETGTPVETVQQLRDMAKNAQPGDRYILMADIDLGGEDWEPIDFKGTLDGNGKTVSNMVITQSVDGNTGFFGCLEGSVYDLHLKNVALTADADYAGLLAGTNRGTVENCTATGSITDKRTESCLGILVGRNDGGKVLSGESTLTATAGSDDPLDMAEGLSGCVALDFPEDRARTVPIVGETSIENVDISMRWQDTTGSFEKLPEAEQQLRQTVVDMLYQMGTVKWTVSEEITYTANDNRKSIHSNAFLPGRTYIGLPYSACEGSFERFMTQMQTGTDSEGRVVTKTGLEDGIKTKAGDVSGFVTMMGNDCVGALIWAYGAAVPYSVEDYGAAFTSPPYMVPNDYNTQHYGVLPAGGYETLESDTSKYSNGIDARDTQDIITLNGGAVEMAEYYARSYRGDYLLCMTYSYNAETDTWKRTANHGRMLAYEPVIVRGYNGKIDLEQSYVLTHEQGDGLYDNRLEDGSYEAYNGFNLKQSSWRTNYRYSLSLLLTKVGYNNAYLPGTGYGYVPVTVAAYSYAEEVPVYACKETEPGVYESNYLTVSATMTVTDSQGAAVYEKTAYLPYATFPEFTVLKEAELFPDLEEDLTAGQTYYRTLTATATGGNTCTVFENEAYTK